MAGLFFLGIPIGIRFFIVVDSGGAQTPYTYIHTCSIYIHIYSGESAPILRTGIASPLSAETRSRAAAASAAAARVQARGTEPESRKR